MEKIDLINEIIELQREVDRAWRLHQLDIGMGMTITMPLLKSLSFISNQGRTGLEKSATAVGVTPKDTTGLTDNLMKQGLASLSEDAENRRMMLIRAWKRRHPTRPVRFRERKRDYMSQALAQLSVDELAGLEQGLKALARAVEANKNTAKSESA
jgi:DNA-binding MarR family transcriptional regulator